MSHSTIFFVLFSPENWDHRRGICRVRSKSKLAVYSYYTVNNDLYLACSYESKCGYRVSRMFMDTPEDERTKLISCLGAFRQFWGTLPQVSTTHKGCPKKTVHRPDLCFLMTWYVSAGVPRAVRTVDREVHTQSAQSQKDRISIRLSGDGCGDQPFTAQVHHAN